MTNPTTTYEPDWTPEQIQVADRLRDIALTSGSISVMDVVNEFHDRLSKVRIDPDGPEADLLAEEMTERLKAAVGTVFDMGSTWDGMVDFASNPDTKPIFDAVFGPGDSDDEVATAIANHPSDDDYYGPSGVDSGQSLTDLLNQLGIAGVLPGIDGDDGPEEAEASEWVNTDDSY